MTAKTKVVLLRLARSAAAAGVGVLAGFVAGPDIAGIVGEGNMWIVTGVVTPALIALDKFVRYGNDPGEQG